MKSNIRRQSPILVRGKRVPRKPLAAAVMTEIEAAIAHTSDRYGISRSFVVAVALAEFFGIDSQEKP